MYVASCCMYTVKKKCPEDITVYYTGNIRSYTNSDIKCLSVARSVVTAEHMRYIVSS